MKGLHRNSLGLDLKPTTKLIFELECFVLYNLNQFKRIAHLLSGGNNVPNSGTLQAPKVPHSQLAKSWLHIWIGLIQKHRLSFSSRSQGIKTNNFNKANIIANEAQRQKYHTEDWCKRGFNLKREVTGFIGSRIIFFKFSFFLLMIVQLNWNLKDSHVFYSTRSLHTKKEPGKQGRMNLWHFRDI